MISAAFFWPMPWIYWSAITTRLLVGILTPAIRATDFSPVTDPFGMRHVPAVLSLAGAHKRERDALALHFRGPASFETILLDAGLIKGFNSVSSTVSMP